MEAIEKHDDENKEERCQIVILILENRRFKVNRQKLIEKSHYFAALLSPNYKEYHKSEYKINYTIPLEIFKVSFILLIQKESHSLIVKYSLSPVLFVSFVRDKYVRNYS